MKTSELTGAQLDYWTARAEGVPAEQLTIRQVPRSTDTHCVRVFQNYGPMALALMYSTDWAQGGLLIEKYGLAVEPSNYESDGKYYAQVFYGDENGSYGPWALIAICRAVVRSVFGEEVEDD